MAKSKGSAADLLRVVEQVAVEKNVERQLVMDAMEQALTRAGRVRYGLEFDIRAHIDGHTGEITMARYRKVVEDVTSRAREISIDQAHRYDASLSLGDMLIEPLPPVPFGRNAVFAARDVIRQKVREAELLRQYEDYKDKVGEIINGTVKSIEFGNVIVDLGTAEGIIRRQELLGREVFHRDDRVRAYVMDVKREGKGPQIFLSRAHPQFVAGLFKQEVSEIYDGVIEIKAVAHEPGSRAKIAVHSHDTNLDPVGACVGMRGSRVQSVVGELKGEKIDIIVWSENITQFVINALSPVEVSKVRLDEELRRIDVVVPENQLSLAIGRRGQNVRLASQLVGWEIDILTEEVESDRRRQEFEEHSKKFIEMLDVEDVIAHLLVTEGFSDIEEIASASLEELEAIEGFDKELAKELKERASESYKKRQRALNKALRVYGLEDTTIDISFERWQHLLNALQENNIKTRDNLADLASDDVYDMVRKKGITRKHAEVLVMQARSHWFEQEKKASDAKKKVTTKGVKATKAQEEAVEATPEATSGAIHGPRHVDESA
ncbi:MAG: transcription termination/antitermination protein NusA [Alphaproteobacteria bacterium GM7ARS4]|nr:transcription termination/antitermination protein NusA [Alphaproteobacteria bacterium GM7ARS4]